MAFFHALKMDFLPFSISRKSTAKKMPWEHESTRYLCTLGISWGTTCWYEARGKFKISNYYFWGSKNIYFLCNFAELLRTKKNIEFIEYRVYRNETKNPNPIPKWSNLISRLTWSTSTQSPTTTPSLTASTWASITSTWSGTFCRCQQRSTSSSTRAVRSRIQVGL